MSGRAEVSFKQFCFLQRLIICWHVLRGYEITFKSTAYVDEP